jgi:DNA-directed RNA polymerase specialized sigma24 family protein
VTRDDLKDDRHGWSNRVREQRQNAEFARETAEVLSGLAKAEQEVWLDIDSRADLSEQRPDLSGLSDAEKEVYKSVEERGFAPAQIARGNPDVTASEVRTLLQRAREKRGEHA